MKKWYIDEPGKIVERLRVIENEHCFTIDKYFGGDYILEVDGQDIMTLNDGEMKKVYDFLKRFYEK